MSTSSPINKKEALAAKIQGQISPLLWRDLYDSQVDDHCVQVAEMDATRKLPLRADTLKLEYQAAIFSLNALGVNPFNESCGRCSL